MRSFTQKLGLVAVAVLLANCGVASDEGVDQDESASTGSTLSDERDGLTPLHAAQKSARVARGNAGAEAIAYLSSAAQSAGVSQPQFKVLSVSEDPIDKLTHVRVQQTHQGVLVWGADSVVHMNGQTVLGAMGTVATKLAGTDTEASLSGSQALSQAKTDRFGTRRVVTERELSEKVIHVGSDGSPRIAIHTAFFNELQGDVQPAFWHHIYDANTGALISRWNELHTTEQASGAGGNPKWVHSWNGELDSERTANGANVTLTTTRLKTLNMRNGSSAGIEVTGPLENIGDAPINDGHGFAEITLNMLQEWMGRNSIDDRGFQIISRVHYGRNYENAFWDGRQMTYGDGATRFYPLSGGLDVCAHEIHHGFTTKHSNLTYSAQSGGLNEGFSDIAGKAAEFYYKPEPNWDLGGDVFKEPGKALRYMCEPRKDNKSIDHVSQYRPGIDVHYSSGIPNKAFCLASKRMSNAGDATGAATKDGVKRAATAFFQANAQYWTASTNFVQGCQGTLDAARALGFTEDEVNMLKTSWADVGAVCN